MLKQMNEKKDEIQELIRNRIETLRLKLLDLSRRNPLISTRFSNRSSAYIRVVDELPDVLAFNLSSGQKMRLVPLPALDDDPRDEQTRKFQKALANALLTDTLYLESIDKIESSSEASFEQTRIFERELRDRLRESLGMPPRQTSKQTSLAQHAKNNGICPSYDLPTPSAVQDDKRHIDSDIQTLLLPDDLVRKLNGLITKKRTWIQETGINVLHAAFGFLEWNDTNSTKSSFAPLILTPIEIEKVKTNEGPEYWVKGVGEEIEINMVLVEKLRLDFGIDLPKFEGGSIEEYFKKIMNISPKSQQWKVRRQIALGIFPSARIAMFHDLDTSRISFEESQIIHKLFGGSDITDATPFADEYEVDSPDIEKKVPFLVLDADSSQYSAMVDIADGRSIAVEGPPGTGKSQTIVNTIAAALAEGKKVLFVAEKSAALNVVKSRLEAIGLGEFILPLQAESSAREHVIKSIRDRVEMATECLPQDFEVKIEKFRQIRSELSDYINIISFPFGNSGFTVHQVIGKCISNSKLLERLPSRLLNPDISDIEEFSKNRIEILRTLGGAIEKAWRCTKSELPYWQGNKVININKFSADEILRLAIKASEHFSDTAAIQDKLRDFSIDSNLKADELNRLHEVLESLESLPKAIDIEFVKSICKSNRVAEVKSFLRSCMDFQEKQSELLTFILDLNDQELSERIKRIYKISLEHDIRTLDSNLLQIIRQKKIDELSKYKEVYTLLKHFVNIFPESSLYPIPMLKIAREHIFSTPREVLALRNEMTSDPASATIISQVATQGRELLARKSSLDTVISTSQEISITELKSDLATIRGASFISIFSSTFRSAKKNYLNLTRRNSFDKKIAAEDIQLLIDWKEEEKNFSCDSQNSRIFGLHFKGIETGFNLFENLNEYLAKVDQFFHGSSNFHLRKFLKIGDIEVLYSIPEINSEVWESSFQELEKEVEKHDLQLRSFNEAVREINTLAEGIREIRDISVESLPALADKIDSYFLQKITINQNNQAKDLLGDRFNEAFTDPLKFECDVIATETILSLGSKVDILCDLIEKQLIKQVRSILEEVITKKKEAYRILTSLSQRTEIDISTFTMDRSSREIADYLWNASKDLNGLYAHSNYATRLKDLEEHGFDWIVSELLNANMPLDDLGLIIEATIFQAAIKLIYFQYGSILSRFNGERLDDNRTLLAQLDREIIQLSREQIRAKLRLKAKPPYGNGHGKKSSWTEMALINSEINKKTRFISVRELTKKAGQSLLELKPCWMMSPLAVAQYLPQGETLFDLCIIDEASQMPPEDAIGALARSKQAMIVGDTNQLPPTNFFRKVLDEEDGDEDESILEESILEMANSTFRPARRLRWHYRSRHSGLIKFSNHMVYNGDLIVFPSAAEEQSDMGVSLINIKGRYRSGTNSEEARIMIDAAIRFMKTTPNRSLGLVTLNQKQRDLLLEGMEYALSQDKIAQEYVEKWTQFNDGLETFFIKNLENVQGDERDVIFIGTVYGPEEIGGRVMQRFGPINGLAGKRRLNVLFSRAKKQIVTFSSMTAADINADENGNAGAYMLKHWLEYAATGILNSGELTNREPDSDFEIYVIDQIRAMGCQPVPQVGVAGYFIDIGVKHPLWPHGFIMAVECDGATYHSSRSARDRDRLRQEVLEGLGWFFYRIWSTDWFNDPYKEAKKLRTAIEKRLDEVKPHVPTASKIPVIGPSRHGSSSMPIGKSVVRQMHEPISDISIESKLVEGKIEQSNCVSVGDKVRIRSLSDDQLVTEYEITEGVNDLDHGMLNLQTPPAKVLIGAEEGEEVEFLVGSFLKRVIIEKIYKKHPNPSNVINIVEKIPPTDHKEAASPHSIVEISENDVAITNDKQAITDFKFELNADHFYDLNYQIVIREFATRLIDSLGPITFQHLSARIARAHNFQRTGSQIKKQVWKVVSKSRKYNKPIKGEIVFWPNNEEAKEIIPFRGLAINGVVRSWQDIPYPEKLGLAQQILALPVQSDPAAAMAAELGLGRLRQTTREELEMLLNTAKKLADENQPS